MPLRIRGRDGLEKPSPVDLLNALDDLPTNGRPGDRIVRGVLVPLRDLSDETSKMNVAGTIVSIFAASENDIKFVRVEE